MKRSPLSIITHLAALAALIAGLLLLSGSAEAAQGIGMDVPSSFESANYPGRYMRHRFSIGELTPVVSELDQKDAKFVLRPALSGAANAVSFESVNYPGHYLRHQNYQIKLHKSDGQELFHRDASFVVRPGLSGLPGTHSFESVNFPGHFIRHTGFQLWIAKSDNTDLFRADASFRQQTSYRFDQQASFQSVNFPEHYIRHRNALGEISRVEKGSNLDRADSTYIVRPALSGTTNAVSFESVNYPGHFLRHQDFRLKLHRNDGGELFAKDASFSVRSGLAEAGAKSYESVNFPGHFIRHSNYQLWIAKSDNSDLFRKDATFRQVYPQYVEPGACTRLFRAYRTGHVDEWRVNACTWIMGIEQYCAARDAFVAVAYYGDRPYRYLTCSPRHRPDTVLEQIEHIGRGVAQGLAEAYVAAAPFLQPAISAIGCVNGVVYACATLAMDLLEYAGVPLTGEAAKALDIANEVKECVDGDITACAKLGARGARAAGIKIPGEDAARVAEDGQKCAGGEFAACVRLGLMAADAAGVPVGLGQGDIADAQSCLNGDDEACAALAKRAAKAAGLPLGGVAEGAENARKCSGGDNNACIQLGKALVTAAR